MCGIVGLFLKDPKLEPKLGDMLTGMRCLRWQQIRSRSAAGSYGLITVKSG